MSLSSREVKREDTFEGAVVRAILANISLEMGRLSLKLALLRLPIFCFTSSVQCQLPAGSPSLLHSIPHVCAETHVGCIARARRRHVSYKHRKTGMISRRVRSACQDKDSHGGSRSDQMRKGGYHRVSSTVSLVYEGLEAQAQAQVAPMRRPRTRLGCRRSAEPPRRGGRYVTLP